jgi:hypothetical protein
MSEQVSIANDKEFQLHCTLFAQSHWSSMSSVWTLTAAFLRRKKVEL